MIEDAKRSIAFLCPVCRKPVIVERTVFQLAAAGSRLPCPCGQSAVEVALLGDQVRLNGRLQSRIYTKVVENRAEERTAFEVSVMSMSRGEELAGDIPIVT